MVRHTDDKDEEDEDEDDDSSTIMQYLQDMIILGKLSEIHTHVRRIFDK
jgi:hypothetical protein